MTFVRHAAAQLIIRGHDAPWLCLLHRPLKGAEIQLPQCPFIHHGVVDKAGALLIVGSKVFQARPHPLALDALDPGCCHLAGEIGVLAEILKISAAKGIALAICAGTQHHRNAHGIRVFTDGSAERAQETAVKGGCGGAGSGEAGGRLAAVDAEVIAVPQLGTKPVRTIRQHDGGGTVMAQILGVPEIRAAAKTGFFLVGEMGEDFLCLLSDVVHASVLLPVLTVL